MSILLKMIKSNLKLLIRNIGFLICLVLLPIGASMILMIQQAGTYVGNLETGITETGANESIISTSLSSMVGVAVIDASQDELSEVFLTSLANGKGCSLFRYKTNETDIEKVKELAKSYYERGAITAVVYLAPDFGKQILAGQTPEVLVIKGREDDRLTFVKSSINQYISLMLDCAKNCAKDCAKNATDNGAIITAYEKAVETIPEVKNEIIGEDDVELSTNQNNQLSNMGYAVAVLTLAFMLTGSFLAAQIISERDNKALMRMEISGVSMMHYVAAKSITAVLVSLMQAAITAIAIMIFVGTDIGIPFLSYIVFVATIGVLFNLFCVMMGIFSKNILTAVYTSFGVWVFTTLLAKVYFNFVTTMPDWWEKLSLLTPQRWMMLCSEMLMKNQTGVYGKFFLVSAGFLILILTAGFVGTKIRVSDE